MTASPLRWPRERELRALAGSPSFGARLAELDAGFPAFLGAAREIAEIPAPSFHEGARAMWVESRMRRAGLAPAIDASGSVVAALPGEEPGIVLAAHTDTVFGVDEDHRVTIDDGRLRGRGIGDNSIGVAALVRIAELLAGVPRRRAFWFAATTGEEGLGDLRGMRSVIGGLAGRIAACVAIEGHFYGRIVALGVGSRRTRIVLRGPGGHSWHDSGRPNAIHGAGALVAALARMRLPRRPRTTLNVGRIAGGRAINIIATEASLEVDLRSERQTTLDRYAARVSETAHAIAAEHGLALELVALGARPAAGISARHPLVRAAEAALALTDASSELEAASTDANYPASLGIPSICIGVSRGAGMHASDEWIEQAAARGGLRQIAILSAALGGVRP